MNTMPDIETQLEGLRERARRIYEHSGGRDWPFPAPHPAGLASCGHPANEDGECSCSWWPERAPAESLAGPAGRLPCSCPPHRQEGPLSLPEAVTVIRALSAAGLTAPLLSDLTQLDITHDQMRVLLQLPSALDQANYLRAVRA